MNRRENLGVEVSLDVCLTDPDDLEECLDRLKEFVWPYAGMLYRRELRGHCEDFVRGLLSDLSRKSTEPIAERAGKHRRGLQRFIGESDWDHTPLIDKMCGHVVDEIGSPEAVLAIDPTAFTKKGKASVGVARQWCGRTGQVENCQLGVFLGYISPKGRTLVDTRLFLPQEWTADEGRRELCHVPKSIKYKTTCELALELFRERRELLPHAWVAADAEFGRSQIFRAALRQMEERYILATEPRQRIREAYPSKLEGNRRTAPIMNAFQFKDGLAAEDWKRVEVRTGTKGPIVVWAARVLVQATLRQRKDKAVEWLLIVRTEAREPEYRYYMSNAEADISLETLVSAAAARWGIEDCFERAKGRVGLGQYEARSWVGWHHHVTLALLSLWFLVLEQKRIGSRTPAITLQQSAEAIGELLRDPKMDVQELAGRITNRLRRNEEARLNHWRRAARTQKLRAPLVNEAQ